MDDIPSDDLAVVVVVSCCNPVADVVDVQLERMEVKQVLEGQQESPSSIWSPCPSIWRDPSGAVRNSCTTLSDC